MWPNPQYAADLITFMKKSLMENLIFCAVAPSKLARYYTICCRKPISQLEITFSKLTIETLEQGVKYVQS